MSDAERPARPWRYVPRYDDESEPERPQAFRLEAPEEWWPRGEPHDTEWSSEQTFTGEFGAFTAFGERIE